MSKQARADRRSTVYFFIWISGCRRTHIEVTFPTRPTKDMTGMTTPFMTNLNLSNILNNIKLFCLYRIMSLSPDELIVALHLQSYHI